MSIQVARLLGCLLPPWSCCFQQTYAVFLKTPSPTPRKKSWFILLEAALQLQSTWPIRSRLQSRKMQTPPWRFGPLSRHRLCGFIFWRASKVSPKFRPQCFSHSRRFAPRGAWRAYFIPHATCGVHPVGAFPAAKPTSLIGNSYPHNVCRSSPTAHRSEWHQLGTPRFQGVNPSSNP
jgi:hypothetical protein